jgi:hypothetical protein
LGGWQLVCCGNIGLLLGLEEGGEALEVYVSVCEAAVLGFGTNLKVVPASAPLVL